MTSTGSADTAPVPSDAERESSPTRDVLLVLGMLVLIAVPAALTLATVRYPPGTVDPAANPTPHGYTVSLLIFAMPVLAIGSWHFFRSRHAVERKALLFASGTVTMLGVTLDFWFGHTFFTFPNEGATLKIRWPAWDLAQGTLVRNYLPIEEYAFYILSGLFMIMLYLWADRYWLRGYSPTSFAQVARSKVKLLEFHGSVFALCLALIAAGWLFKKYGPSDHPEGFPGYFTFQMCLAFLPTVVCFRAVRTFINWRAFGFGYFMLMLVSLVWEATLAVPYGWWNYKSDQMLGIHILAWGRLPIEAVLLWLIAGWGAIICFEFYRVLFHMDRPLRDALIGIGKARRPS